VASLRFNHNRKRLQERYLWLRTASIKVIIVSCVDCFPCTVVRNEQYFPLQVVALACFSTVSALLYRSRAGIEKSRGRVFTPCGRTGVASESNAALILFIYFRARKPPSAAHPPMPSAVRASTATEVIGGGLLVKCHVHPQQAGSFRG